MVKPIDVNVFHLTLNTPDTRTGNPFGKANPPATPRTVMNKIGLNRIDRTVFIIKMYFWFLASLLA